MKFTSLTVENFRAINRLEMTELPDTVLIAGPNGCGKSSVLHAIRLFKSIYGGYAANEYQNWFGEFAINVAGTSEGMKRVLQNPSKPLRVSATLTLGEEEVQYIRLHVEDLVSQIIWKTTCPELFDYRNHNFVLANPYYQEKEPYIRGKTQEFIPRVLQQLESRKISGAFLLHPNGQIDKDTSLLLEIAFGSFKPGYIGIIDYHGPDRNYAREQFGAINLNLEPESERLRQTSLYNTAGKYTNVKSEMAAAYVRGIISAAAGSTPDGVDVIEALKDLFKTFFPGKQFLGPIPNSEGTLDFPVQLESGKQHDIDDLSSGEKEVLYGYLRLRSNAPKHSVIMLDEPELHLNPRLIKGLAGFYQRYLGAALSNQLWLVTHSDALLRDAVENEGLAVYHMEPAHLSAESANQLHVVSAQKEIDRALIDLVGDLATYRPGQRVVVIEGAENGIDASMIEKLFPDIASRVNLVSAGSKRSVRAQQAMLRESAVASKAGLKIYAIVDNDSTNEDLSDDQFCWDRYHIENYLLEPDIIADVTNNILGEQRITAEMAYSTLEASARACIEKLINREVGSWARNLVQFRAELGFNPNQELTPILLREAVERSVKNVSTLASSELSEAQIQSRIEITRSKLEADLASGNWVSSVPGRDIIHRYINIVNVGISYEVFRNLVLSEMRQRSRRPTGMRVVLEQIVAIS